MRLKYQYLEMPNERPLQAQSRHSAEYKNIRKPFYGIVMFLHFYIKTMTLIPLDRKQFILRDLCRITEITVAWFVKEPAAALFA